MTWVLEQRQALSHFLLVDDEGEEDRLPAELGLLLKVGAASTGGRAHTPIGVSAPNQFRVRVQYCPRSSQPTTPNR